MSTVTKIPATIGLYTKLSIDNKIKRKVAAYARVSTNSDEQFSSYEAQISYYTNYIRSRDDWKFVKMYTDEGISGCSTKKREGFKMMIQDALDGKIDLIITKSVSRFARNTVDSLTTIRMLKENNIECYFEKENIWTFDSKGELLITIMSSISQEEARSISENVTWGKRKSMSDGKVSIAYSRFLGYDKDINGKMVINPEQAKIVKLIYSEFLKGRSPYHIANYLTNNGIKTVTGKDKWSRHTVWRILTNEKYKGDALLQKEFTADFLTKKKQKNHGQIPMYYIEGDHEPIIEPEIFDTVQYEIIKRRRGRSGYSGISLFSGKIKCGQCGSWYGAKIWHSTTKYRKIVYRCNHKYKGEKCRTPYITEEEIKALFIERINRFIEERTVKDHDMTYTQIYDAKVRHIKHQTDTAAKHTDFRVDYSDLIMRYEDAKAKAYYAKVVDTIMVKQKKMLTDFDEELWQTVVDHIIINEDGSKTITLRDGTEL